MKKFEERIRSVLPREELPEFWAAIARLGARPRKSLRIRRDLSPESAEKWTAERFREFGIPVGEAVGWYDRGFFFDLSAMKPHPSVHPAIAAGIVFIQEAGAMEVVPALEVEAEDLVLDLCAAPGAKSTHLGEYLGPGSEESGGWLVANEPVRDRAKVLDSILARHGIGNSTVFNLEPHRLSPFFPSVFDRVLVDVPCSGESLFAKRTEKRKDVSHREVERCALRGRAILDRAWETLAPGGRLVYSTCAYSREENESVVEDFLGKRPPGESILISERRRFPHRDGVPGGYFAVIGKSGDREPRESRRKRLRDGIRSIGTLGLVRDGRRRWDGSIDEYAFLMDRKSDRKTDRKTIDRSDEAEIVSLGFSDSVRLLVGDLPEDRLKDRPSRRVYLWENETLAGRSGGTLHYPRSRLGGRRGIDAFRL